MTVPDGVAPVAIVTGGTRGIGRAVVERLHQDGHAVLFTHSASPADAAQLVAGLGAPPTVAALQVDVSERHAAETIVDAARAMGPLRVLVNNAGVTGPLGELVDLTDESLDRVLAVNLAAPARLIRQALRRHDSGPLAIVNISSVAARTGSPGDYVVYAATKAGLEALTIGVAKEVAARGVRVNAVAPGFIDTTIHARAGEAGRAFRLGAATPMRRPGTVDEVAAAVAWLVTDEASYVTGEVVNVTGGA